MATTRDLTCEYLRNILDYDAETGVFRWRRCDFKLKNWNSRFHGRIAGGVKDNGYRRIGINGRDFLEHRLAWLFTTGSNPVDEIDHINGVRTDNRIANLRECSRIQNAHNIDKHKDNTSGFVGVTWNAYAGKWQAQISVHKHRMYLGVFDTPELASAAYISAKRKFHPFQPEPR